MWTKWPPEFKLSTEPGFPQKFPNLKPEACFNGVSPETDSYNCVAWGASDAKNWWEPDDEMQYYWPDNAPRNYTVDAYVAALRVRGFEVCQDASLEPGLEKVAIFTLQREFQHVARQLADGNWTSKMGPCEDIQHTELSAVAGPFYGNPSSYMARKVK